MKDNNKIVTNEDILSALHAFMQSTEKEFETIKTRFDNVDQKFDGVDRRFDGVDQKFKSVDRRFDDIEQAFSGVGEEISSINGRLEGVEVGLRDIKGDVQDLKQASYRHDVTIRELSNTAKTTYDELLNVHGDMDEILHRLIRLEKRPKQQAA